jgi:16S rRNA U1498 N3-methylase RsmE
MGSGVNYPVKVSRMKNGAFLAAITNDKGEVLKEIYSHYPEMGEKANIFLLKKQVEILVWTDKISEDK